MCLNANIEVEVNMSEYLINLILIINFVMALFLFIVSIYKSRTYNTVFFGFITSIVLFITIGLWILVKANTTYGFFVGYRLYACGLIIYPVYCYFFIKDLFSTENITGKSILLHSIFPTIVVLSFLLLPWEYFIGSNGEGGLVTINIGIYYNIFFVKDLHIKIFSMVFCSFYTVKSIIVISKNLKTKHVYLKKVAKVSMLTILIPAVLSNLAYTGLFMENKPILESLAYTCVCVLLIYDVFYLKMLNTTPLSDSNIINSLREVYISADKRNEITDCNVAAENFFGENVRRANLPFSVTNLKNFPIDWLKDNSDNYTMEFENGGNKKYYRFSKSKLNNMDVCVLAYDITTYEKLHRELEEKASLDSLTGVLNRRKFFEISPKYIDDSFKQNKQLFLFFIDVDRFKRINDNYGHLAGDYVLVNICKLIKKYLSKEDIFCRYGGEEFIIISNNFNLINTIRKAVEEYEFEFNEELIKTTISCGVVKLENLQKNTINVAISKADKKLYDAKSGGRNKVIY